MEIFIWIVGAVARETMLFAAMGFVVGGVDDLIIDLIWLVRRFRDRWRADALLSDLPPVSTPGRFAIFIAAWDESRVIGAMLSAALARYDHPNYRIYVGTYPNDPATCDAVAAVSAIDPRVRLAIGSRDGPTTKADNLNVLWRALLADDEASQEKTRAIILHDAEDLVHPDELRVFDSLLARHAVVQLPVLPLIDPRARFVSGHYADEFAEAHAKQLVVRAALRVGLPLAGVGCAVSLAALRDLEARHGVPFDASSLTEDYELGLRLAQLGHSTCFARVRDSQGGPIAVRAYFPSTVRAAVRQKARWMTGIALAGWDRLGWGRALDFKDHWMRMRDRRAPLAVLVLAIAYLAMLLWGLSAALHWATGLPAPGPDRFTGFVLGINLCLLLWRFAIRGFIVSAAYGWREGLWAIPRVFVANYIALMAVRSALGRYRRTDNGVVPRWDKTDHVFPDLGQATAL